MLVTDVGDEMCWRQLWDVSDGFDRFRHQHPLSFNIIVGHQDSKDVTNIKIHQYQSPISAWNFQGSGRNPRTRVYWYWCILAETNFSYPWQVWFTTPGGSCAGSIIHRRWILTAAHCCLDKRTPPPRKPWEKITVIMGDYDKSISGEVKVVPQLSRVPRTGLDRIVRESL